MREGLVALGVVVGLAGLTVSNAGAADRQKVWQGFLSITNRTAQCSGVPGTTGTHVSIFRPKLADAFVDSKLRRADGRGLPDRQDPGQRSGSERQRQLRLRLSVLV